MELTRLAGVLAAGAIAVWAGCHPAGDAPDCGGACQRLERCGFLPSILGARSDTPFSDALSDCNARCQFSTDLQDQNQIIECSSNQRCDDVATCLHGFYPESPVTGTSRVELVGSVPDATDGGLQLACAQDAGAAVAFARGFVEIWGTRSYSDNQPCALPLQVDFRDVPAAPALSMGFQISLAGACSEYARVHDVEAGFDPLSVPIDLGGASTSCVPDAPSDAGMNPGDAGPPDATPDGGNP